jgi:LacI family transcriptional regulator
MPEPKRHFEDLLGGRRDWTPIALWLAHSGGPIGPMLLELARQRRWQLIDVNSFDGYPPPNINVRGALIDQLPTVPQVQAMHERGIPIVRLGKWSHPDDDQVPAVLPDHAAAGRLAAEHFAERDFKHIACVGHDPWGPNQETYEAFASRGGELGCTCDLLRDRDIPSAEFGSAQARLAHRQQQFAQWLGQLSRPVGLLAFGDQLADRFAQWIAAAGLSIPRDVAVLGIGDDRMICECAIKPISSIAHDTARIVDTAVKTLARLMEGRALEQTTIRILPLGVVSRQTTDTVASSDPYVSKALRFIWDHIDQDLSVDQIADHVGVARRTLERAFQRDLGRGINQEFRRRQMDRARELMLQTDLRIGDIAAMLSFSSTAAFCRLFRTTFGTSPAEYRRTHSAGD